MAANKTRIDPNKSIWVIDDDDAHVLVMEEVLNRSGLRNTSRFFANGEEALDAMRQIDKDDPRFPGLVLLDVNMPRVSGFDVLSRIRSDVRFCEAVVVMLSSSDRDKDKKRSIDLGADDYFVKVTRIQGYIDLVDRAFTN